MEPKRAAEAADRLSSLPVELQDEILVRLDLRDAVRTSALSRAWRHLWESLSVLSLSFPSGTHPSVIDSVLPRYTGPRVSLFYILVDDASQVRVDDWLVALSRYRVESIHMAGWLGYFNIQSSIFSFGDLVSLRLHHCNIPPLPVGFAGFPALQELDLISVYFPANRENQLEVMVRRSPLLHALYLSNAFIPADCPESVIEAPNLRSLSIHVDVECENGWRIGELPCLEDAEIDVGYYPHDFGDLFARLAHVMKLILHFPFIDVKIPYTLPFTFYNLKLELHIDFTQRNSVLLMFTLLRSCHNLENLEIEFRESADNVEENRNWEFDDDQSIEATWEFLNSLWTDGMCANLQVVQIRCIYWLPIEISFMKLILSKARLLRTLYVDRSPGASRYFDDPIIDLLKCKRASAQAHVLFKGLVRQY